HPLERRCNYSSCQQEILRARRSYREFPIGGPALRPRVWAFLASPIGKARRRSHLHPGTFIARNLRSRLRRGSAQRAAAPELSPGSRRYRPLILSTSMADAGLLAVPHLG